MKTRKELEAREKIYEEIVAIYNKNTNVTLTKLAKQFNVSYPSLRKYAIKIGCKIRRSFSIIRTDDSIVQAAVSDYISDSTSNITTIAKKYAISKPTLVRWIHDQGYQTHNGHTIKPIEDNKLNKALDYYFHTKPNSIQAAKYAGIGKNKFRSYLKEHNLLQKPIKIQKNIKYDSAFFNILDTEEKAYWFGFIYGDGCVRNTDQVHQLTIELQESDANHLEKFKQSIRSNKDLAFRTRKNTTGSYSKMCSICISSIKMVNDLINKGCIPNKTCSGDISYCFDDKSLCAAFLRGYIDADGWISKKPYEYSMSIVVKSYKVLNYLNRMIINLSGVIPFIRYENDKLGGAYRIRITNKKDFFQFLNVIYQDATIYMDRKYESYKLHCRPESTTAEDSESINGVLSGKAVTP